MGSNRPSDRQVGGSYYKKMKIQVTEFTHANGLDGMQHSVIKYICRYKDKNGLQDLEKAKHYIDLLIEYEYGHERTERRVLPEVSRQPESEEATGGSQPSTARSRESWKSIQRGREGGRPQTSFEQRGFDQPIEHPSDFEKEEPFLPTG